MNKRICQACRKEFNKEELIKITKLKDGSLKINPTTSELGRSAYVCKSLECLKILIKKKRLKSALKYNNIEEISRVEELLGDIIKQHNT